MEVISLGSIQRVMIWRKDDHVKCSNSHNIWADITDICFKIMIMTSWPWFRVMCITSSYIGADAYDSETEGHGPYLDVLKYKDSEWQRHTAGEENHRDNLNIRSVAYDLC